MSEDRFVVTQGSSTETARPCAPVRGDSLPCRREADGTAVALRATVRPAGGPVVAAGVTPLRAGSVPVNQQPGHRGDNYEERRQFQALTLRTVVI